MNVFISTKSTYSRYTLKKKPKLAGLQDAMSALGASRISGVKIEGINDHFQQTASPAKPIMFANVINLFCIHPHFFSLKYDFTGLVFTVYHLFYVLVFFYVSMALGPGLHRLHPKIPRLFHCHNTLWGLTG